MGVVELNWEKAKPQIFSQFDVLKLKKELSDINNADGLLEKVQELTQFIHVGVGAILRNVERIDNLTEEDLKAIAKMLDDLVEFKGLLSVVDMFDEKFFESIVKSTYDAIMEALKDPQEA